MGEDIRSHIDTTLADLNGRWPERKRRTGLEPASSPWKGEALPLSYRRAEETAPLCGAASMTVCTNDVALCNLVEHVLPAPALDALRDRELLVPQVIELEDDRIALATVDAWVLSQKRNQKEGPFFDQRLLSLASQGDVSLFVGQVMLSMVGRSAGPAIVVALPSCPPPPGEFIQRFLALAASASPHKSKIFRRTDVPMGTATSNPSK
jgi:hypothetical protein